jgi:hypothetical protein
MYVVFCEVLMRGRRIAAGEFSCEVSDWNQVERKSISIYIVPIPEIDLSPLHVTLREGEKGAMTCMSRDDEHANFTYSWLYNGRPLTTGPNGEHVEKLAPIGSRLTLKRVTQAASYTCVVRSLAGTASKTTIVSLLAGTQIHYVLLAGYTDTATSRCTDTLCPYWQVHILANYTE